MRGTDRGAGHGRNAEGSAPGARPVDAAIRPAPGRCSRTPGDRAGARQAGPRAEASHGQQRGQPTPSGKHILGLRPALLTSLSVLLVLILRGWSCVPAIASQIGFFECALVGCCPTPFPSLPLVSEHGIMMALTASLAP